MQNAKCKPGMVRVPWVNVVATATRMQQANWV